MALTRLRAAAHGRESFGGDTVESTQGRLFVLAPEVLTFNARWVWREGWHVTVTMRRQGETWDEASTTTYDRLGPGELLDTVCAELGRSLGL